MGLLWHSKTLTSFHLRQKPWPSHHSFLLFKVKHPMIPVT